MECPFCKIKDTLLENDKSFAIYDKYPVNNGHILIIPKRHINSFFETTKEEKKSLLDLLEKAKTFLDDNLNPDGYNIGINEGKYAGQTIDHLHIHLIPRYHGDIEDPTGGVRGVIPDKRVYKWSSVSI